MNSLIDKRLKEILDTRLSEKDPLIQVILGPRQVGKTSFIQKYISKSKKYAFHSGDGIHDPIWIQEKWNEATDKNQILIIDEVQKIPQWSEYIKLCWDKQKLKKNRIQCILLGSSSLSLEKGLSESLTGRFEVIRAFHWSYNESIRLKKMSIDEYLHYGGYPGSYKFINSQDRWQDFIRTSIIETVISKDILLQARVKSPALFRQCFYVLANLPAQAMSLNKILGQLQDKGNIDLVKYYIDLFEGAFLLKAVQKFSHNEIKKKQSSPKIIFYAPALNTFHRQDNLSPEYMGRVFESYVGALLLRYNQNLYYWSDGDYEVDFVMTLKNKIIAIEVKSGRNKKSNSLVKFKEKYPEANVVFITKENYLSFEKDPIAFIQDKI